MAPRKKKNEDDKKILRYPDEAMQSAIAAVRENRFKIREAGRHYGVPHSTLINKLKGRVPEVRKMGRDTYFTVAEENLLEKYIIANAKKGIPLKKETLLDTVKKILDDDERVTPFKNNRPGRKWFDLYLKRHVAIGQRNAESISTARAFVSADDLKEWHKSLEKYLAEENALDILNEPARIFNADESGFQTCPDSGKVLGPVGMKNFYEIKSGKEKEQLTVMVTINAAGQVVSPMIVYPLMRISKEIAMNIPQDWSIGKSPKGWMTGPLYYEFIANVFDPWLKTNNIKKPVLLLIDGHRSHMTLQVSQYCALNQILAYALFPNSTHITQPADVSVFKCLKSGWKHTVAEYKKTTGNRQITRSGFAPLLAKVFEEKVTADIIANGFKRCGIYPFNIDAIDFARCMDHKTRKVLPTLAPVSNVGVETLLFFESFMKKGRAQEFRQRKEWNGDESAKELFEVWKKIHQYIHEENKEREQSPKEITDAPTNEIACYSSPRSSSPSILSEKIASNISCPPKSPQPRKVITPVVSPRNVSKLYELTPRKYGSCASTSPMLCSKTPDFPEESKTPTRCHTPISDTELRDAVSIAPMLPSPKASFIDGSSKTLDADASITSTPPQKLIQIVSQKQKQVSSAFGNHIIWPSDSPLKKRKTERLPFATTSKKWQEYWISKEKEKTEKEAKIESNKRKREEKMGKKKPPKSESKRMVISSDSSSDPETEIQENDESSTEKETESKRELELEVGYYVIFVYEGAFYVGKIESLSIEGVLIKSMKQSLKNWKWPEKEDVTLYNVSDIKEKIEEPELINAKRGIYYVREFEKYQEFY